MKNIQNLTIDINKKPFQTITANRGEVGSRFIRITIVDNSTPVDLTGVTISLYAKKPDGKKVFNSVTVEDKTNGIVLAELTSQILSVVGIVRLTLLLVKNGSKLASKQFLVNVDESIVDDEAIESTNEFTALVDALGRVNNIDSRFEEVDSQLEQNMNKVNEQFNTIESKKLDKNDILSMSNMGQDVKEAMTGGSVAVVGKDTILTENIVDNQVTTEKVSFIEDRRKEMFNDEFANICLDSTNGMSYWYQDGMKSVLLDLTQLNGDYAYKITCKHNNRFRIGAFRNFPEVVDESNKKSVQYVLINDSINTYRFWKDQYVNEGYKYLVFYVANGDVDNVSVSIKGDYSDFILNDINVNGANIEDSSITATKLKNSTITTDKLAFVTNEEGMSGELFDGVFTDFALGVSGSTMHYYREEGCKSAIIKISNGRYKVLVNSNNRFRIALMKSYPLDVFIDNKIDVDCMLVNDNSLKEFEFENSKFNYVVIYLNNDGITPSLTFKAISTPNSLTGIRVDGNIINDNSIPVSKIKGTLSNSYTPFNVIAYDGSDGNKNLDDFNLNDLYSKWDDLISKYPSIKKSILGKDQSGVYDFWKLEIKPDCPECKIIIGCNIHGNGNGGDSQNVSIAIYHFIKDMFENWKNDSILEWLYLNVHFIILPCENPYGYENKTRYNSRGVDLNRNFDFKWEEFSSSTKGSVPFSEIESQYIRDILIANSDACAYYALHSWGWNGSLQTFKWWNVVHSKNSKCYNILSKVTTVANKNIGATVDIDTVGYANLPNAFNYSENVANIPSCNQEFVTYSTKFKPHSKEQMELIISYYGNAIYKHCKEYCYNLNFR